MIRYRVLFYIFTWSESVKYCDGFSCAVFFCYAYYCCVFFCESQPR